jgi:phosphomannomutase
MSVVDLARAWVDQDPDTKTRAELERLIQVNDLAGLEDRFSQLLQFGTAGLRGELGAGPNRMNRIVVSYAALAIARFLNSQKTLYQDSNGRLLVVIGYDGRENSDIFARDTAEILAAAGCKALLFQTTVPTPVAAFTGKRLGASATIVVTASHNPPRDNGYKVYLGGANGGSQLISPQDKEIAELITQISKTETFGSIQHSSDIEPLTARDISLYIDRALTLIAKNNPQRSDLKITHTALHGVGWPVVEDIFSSAGFTVEPVSAQQKADPAFPTVKFPNPEEPGAMDLAIAAAEENQSDLILANDPDADRLAVAVPTADGWRMLTGDQVGLILADYVAQAKKSGTLANSIVSANLRKLAEYHKLDYQQTLTGFKWISKVPNLVYGYEEALGYCVDPLQTPDKDGITAALLIAELAAYLKSQGKSLLDRLTELNEKFGEISTGQVSIRVQELSVIGKIMQHVRNQPPTDFDGNLIMTDLAKSESMKTDAVILENEKVRMIFRPSGTEPKLKCYLQYNGSESDLARLKNFAASYLSAAQ